MLVTEIPTLDHVLRTYADALGDDFVAYRHHTYRVANLCFALASPQPQPHVVDKIAIAAAFHDLGIWTDHTFDYLQPSVRLVTAYLAQIGRGAWAEEIAAMILQHHKVLPSRREPYSLVEPFRRADWTDVTMGLATIGRTRRLVRALYATWPSAGFHARLVGLTLERWRAHPLSPLPMVRL
jgi:hypothetical protein